MRFSPQGKPVHGANGARENASAGSAVGDDGNAVLEPRFGGDEPWHGFPPGQTKRCSETGRQIRAGYCQHFLEKAAADRTGPRARTDLAGMGMDVPRLRAGGGTGGQHP